MILNLISFGFIIVCGKEQWPGTVLYIRFSCCRAVELLETLLLRWASNAILRL
jgi:hypothetical protein